MSFEVNGLELRAFTARLHELVLAARPSLVTQETTPVLGVTYDLLLLQGDKILSAPTEGKKSITGKTLTQVYEIDEECAARVRHYLLMPNTDFFAIRLPCAERIALVAAIPTLSNGEGVAIVPRLDESSVARVLGYSFCRRVSLTDEITRLSEAPLRASDENIYVFLERLLRNWRCLMYGDRSEGIWIEDRRMLSTQMQLTGRLLTTFFGKSTGETETSLFPLPYPFGGRYYPARAAWMYLCFCCGLWRCLPNAIPTLRYIPDNERLLPMVEIKMGNRSQLPSEWMACHASLERYGMLYEVTRTKSAVRIALCPITPELEPSVFYSLRASSAVLWQLRTKLGLDLDIKNAPSD